MPTLTQVFKASLGTHPGPWAWIIFDFSLRLIGISVLIGWMSYQFLNGVTSGWSPSELKSWLCMYMGVQIGVHLITVPVISSQAERAIRIVGLGIEEWVLGLLFEGTQQATTRELLVWKNYSHITKYIDNSYRFFFDGLRLVFNSLLTITGVVQISFLCPQLLLYWFLFFGFCYRRFVHSLNSNRVRIGQWTQTHQTNSKKFLQWVQDVIIMQSWNDPDAGTIYKQWCVHIKNSINHFFNVQDVSERRIQTRVLVFGLLSTATVLWSYIHWELGPLVKLAIIFSNFWQIPWTFNSVGVFLASQKRNQATAAAVEVCIQKAKAHRHQKIRQLTLNDWCGVSSIYIDGIVHHEREIDGKIVGRGITTVKLNLDNGKSYAIEGNNGCGKSTMFNALRGNKRFVGQVTFHYKDKRSMTHSDFHSLESLIFLTPQGATPPREVPNWMIFLGIPQCSSNVTPNLENWQQVLGKCISMLFTWPWFLMNNDDVKLPDANPCHVQISDNDIERVIHYMKDIGDDNFWKDVVMPFLRTHGHDSIDSWEQLKKNPKACQTLMRESFDDPKAEPSGGQKSLIMAIRAFCQQHRCPIMLLDEITAALDKDNVLRLLKKVRDVDIQNTIRLSIVHNLPDEIMDKLFHGRIECTRKGDEGSIVNIH